MVAGQLQDLQDSGQCVAEEVGVELGDHQAVALEVNLTAGDGELVRHGGVLLVPGAHLPEVGDESGEGVPDHAGDAGEVLHPGGEEGDDVGPRLVRQGLGEDQRQDVRGNHRALGEVGDNAEALQGGGVEVLDYDVPLRADRGLAERGLVNVGDGAHRGALLLRKTLEAPADGVEEVVVGEVVAVHAPELQDDVVARGEDGEVDVAGDNPELALEVVLEAGGEPLPVPLPNLDTALLEDCRKVREVVGAAGGEVGGLQVPRGGVVGPGAVGRGDYRGRGEGVQRPRSVRGEPRDRSQVNEEGHV